MEKELTGLTFPAYGSLFLRDSTPSGYHHYPLPSDLDPAGVFCVGPSCDQSLWDESRSLSEIGPWQSLSDFARSIADRELSRAVDQKEVVQRHLDQFSENQSVVEYSDLLRKARQVLATLSNDWRVLGVAESVLWHTDLHLGNIFVAPDDPTTIEGILDWQSVCVSPLFLQAQFPEFVRPPKGYNPGTEVPALPDNYEQLDPELKERATRDNALASRSKYYEMSCLAYNKNVYHAMKLDRRVWEPFTCCQVSLRGSLVPLRNALVRISQDWAALELSGSSPFAFSEEMLNMHSEQVTKYQDMIYLWDIVRDQLCTDSSGWVPQERWEETNQLNKDIFSMYINTMSEELPPDVASKLWPFPPR